MKLNVQKGVKSVKEIMAKIGLTDFVFTQKGSKFVIMSYKQCNICKTAPLWMDIDVMISATCWFTISMKNNYRTVSDVYRAAETLNNSTYWRASVGGDVLEMSYGAHCIDNDDLKINLERALQDLSTESRQRTFSLLGYRK